MKCAFCDTNEATHFNMDWDAMLCDECPEAQLPTPADRQAVADWLRRIQKGR